MADGSLGTELKSKTALSAAAVKDDAYDTLLSELGQAQAIVDLLFMVACGKAVDSVDGMREGTLASSLHIVLERLKAVKDAAEAFANG